MPDGETGVKYIGEAKPSGARVGRVWCGVAAGIAWGGSAYGHRVYGDDEDV